MKLGPKAPLAGIKETAENDEEQDNFDPHAFTDFGLWLGRPGQESGNVRRHLIDAGFGSIAIGNPALSEGGRHGDLMARKPLIVIHARG